MSLASLSDIFAHPSVVPFCRFFCATTFFYIGAFIYLKDRSSPLNRTIALFHMCCSFWSFTITFAYPASNSIATAQFFYNLSSLGWISFASLNVFFALVFIEKTYLLKKPITIVGLILLPLFFIWAQFHGWLLIVTPDTLTKFGWLYSWNTPFAYLFFLYYLCCGLLSGVLMYCYGSKTPYRYKRIQAQIIVYSAIPSYILASFFDTIAPLFKMYSVPPIGEFVGGLIWSYGMLLAMVRYRFLAVHPVAAADTIIKAVNDGLIIVDETGSIRAVNNSLLDLLGYAQEQVVNKPLELLGKNLLPETHHVLKGDLGHYEEDIITRRGSTIPVMVSAANITDAGGYIVGAVLLVRDISRQKKAEREILNAKSAAEIANSAKSRFLATVSHEVRTPMNAIIGFSELLKETELTGQQREYVGVIQDSSQVLLALVNDMLDISRIEKGQLSFESKPFDLVHLAENIVKTSGFRLKDRSVTLHYSYDESLPRRFVGDALRVRQVMNNIIGNAIKFTEQGTIDVAISRGEGQCERGDPAMRKVKISVRDTGIGISKDRRELLFNPFLQVRASYTKTHEGLGLGLGLYICKSIVTSMGGDIRIMSEEGKGTEVIVDFCLREASEGER